MFIPQMTSTITEKVNKFILYASSCGGKQATPPIPRILCVTVNLANGSQFLQENISVKDLEEQGKKIK
jgi:hypothetical protein